MSERQITHFVGDDCAPNGHRSDDSGAPLSEKRIQTSDTSPSIQERLRGEANRWETRRSTASMAEEHDAYRIARDFMNETADHIDRLSQRIAELEADRDAS